jgi:hypothetical protein
MACYLAREHISPRASAFKAKLGSRQLRATAREQLLEGAAELFASSSGGKPSTPEVFVDFADATHEPALGLKCAKSMP